MKHHLVLVGFLSEYHAYLDMTREEAQAKHAQYCQREGMVGPDWDDKWETKEFDFNEHFHVYDAEANED